MSAEKSELVIYDSKGRAYTEEQLAKFVSLAETYPAEDSRKVKLVCPYCGSDDIIRDGPLVWDTDTQAWHSNGDVYDEMSCEDCGRDINEAGEVEISPASPPAPQR